MREDSAHFIDQSACPTRHMARTFVQFHGAYRQEFDPQISQMTQIKKMKGEKERTVERSWDLNCGVKFIS
ncbi:MAG TPA: hypothetical protein VHD56_07000, partial [Tepidisphaeraceae bacterium]|nr:hypothetical protein [Tepidisphaeraceae bacterium]